MTVGSLEDDFGRGRLSKDATSEHERLLLQMAVAGSRELGAESSGGGTANVKVPRWE